MQAARQQENTAHHDDGIIRILVADDHEMILDIARLYLDQSSDMSVATATTLDDAVTVFTNDGPFDVVLLDYNMPGMNGFEGLTRMRTMAGDAPVAIFTGNPTRNLLDEALSLGSAGLISKSLPVRSLANAIRFIHAGETYTPLHLMTSEKEPEVEKAGPLSARESTVLKFLGEGKKNREIADSLKLSEGTVKMHVMSICKKLEASNRTHAVVIAQERNLL